MANYISSLLLDFQTKPNGVFSELEMREKRSQLMDLFLKNPTNVFDNWENLKTSDQRAGKAYLLKRTKNAVGTNREANHQGSFGDSIAKDLIWKTYQSKFKVSMKQGDRNVFDNPSRFENSLKNAILDIHEAIDADLNSWMATQKSQLVETTVGKATWNATGFNYEVDLAEKDYFFQILKSVMRRNGYKGGLDIVADSIQLMEAERLFSNGTQNATNTAFQASNLSIYEDHNLSDSAYTHVGYAIPNGGVALLPWIPTVNRNTEGNENGVTGVFTKIQDPLGTGLDFAVHYKKGLADTNAIGGEYQDVVTEFEVSIDLAVESAPLSGTDESCIVKFAQKKA